MVFAAIHCNPILSDLAEGGNRQYLPAFCQFWRNAEGRLAGIWRRARQLIAAKEIAKKRSCDGLCYHPEGELKNAVSHAPAIPSCRKPRPGWSGTSGGLRRLNQRYLMLRQPVEGRVVCAYWTQSCFFELGSDSGKIEDRQAGFISEAAPELYCRHLCWVVLNFQAPLLGNA